MSIASWSRVVMSEKGMPAEKEMTGYTVAYGRDEAPFPVYAASALGAILVDNQAFNSAAERSMSGSVKSTLPCR